MSYKVISTIVLDGIEKYFCIHGGWMTIAHAAHLTGNRLKIIDNASNTLQCLLKRHSRMRTRIRMDEKNQYFIDTLEYNCEDLSSNLFFSIRDTTNQSWEEIVEHQCNEDPYSDDGTIIFPTFHFMLVFNSLQSNDPQQPFHLILFQNHCVSDGRSGLTLIHEFLTLSTTPTINSNLIEPLNNEILPLIGSFIPRPYGRLYPLISFIGRQIFKRNFRHLTHPRIPVKVTPLPKNDYKTTTTPRYQMKFVFASSSSNLYSKLHSQCRQHQVTLNGPLLECLLLAIHHCFPLNNNNKDDHRRLKPFEIGIPFNMRSRLPHSSLTSSSIGFFVGMSDVKLKRSFSIESTRFWSLAHQCMTLTQDQLQRNGVPLTMNIFADVLANERDFERVARLFPEGRQSEFAFSNIGKYPFSCDYNQDEIQLRGMHIVNNCSVYRTSSALFVVCTDNGQLDLSLAHEMVSEQMAQTFLQYYIRLIEICADSERCQTETTLDQLLNMVE